MRPSALLPLLLLSPAAALAQEGRQWIGDAWPEGASLVYGTPHSDDTAIVFSCDVATRQLGITIRFEPATVGDGDTVAFTLASEAGGVMLHGSAAQWELDDAFAVEASTRLTPELRRVIEEGQTLLITADGDLQEVPLAGAADAGSALLKACQG